MALLTLPFMGELRYGDDTVPAKQWDVIGRNGAIVANVFEVPGNTAAAFAFEMWRGGEMTEFRSLEHVRAFVRAWEV